MNIFLPQIILAKVLPVQFLVYFPLLDLAGSRFETSVLNTVNSLSSFTNACGKVRILKITVFYNCGSKCPKMWLMALSLLMVFINKLILTKNLFIDRDINDIKDPKNESPNSIFKNFHL